ncbi:MAG: hypothetical protein ACTHQQ_22570 [Solirubrobacteraceae bacterium]
MPLAKIRTIAWVSLAAAVAALALAACGSGGGDPGQAQSLLHQAFKAHPINSGKLRVALAVAPSGSQTLMGPIALNFGGPFQSLGNGKTPKSDFTLRLSAFGRSGSLGIISTGTKGYVTLQGTSYRLPAATFRQFESGLAPVSRSGSLGKLPKVDFLSWVRNPVVVGHQTVAGADTTQVHGGIDVHTMLSDLNSIVHKAPSAGVSGLGSGISSAAIARIASKVRNPTLDVWVGSSDRTMRKLALNFGVPVTGAASTLFGGLHAAHVALTIQYADINQPQTITAPSSARPFTEFASKLRGFLQDLQGTLGASSPLSGGGSSGGGSASGQKLQGYTKRIKSAGNDVVKMQRCAALLNGQ